MARCYPCNGTGFVTNADGKTARCSECDGWGREPHRPKVEIEKGLYARVRLAARLENMTIRKWVHMVITRALT